MNTIKALKFESVSFAYGHQDPIFENVDFVFPMNEIILIKADGSSEGRSTLLQLMAGLIVPTHGNYLINDLNVADMSFDEFLPYRLGIGYGFDYGGLLHNKTLLENLTLPLLYHQRLGADEAVERAQDYLNKIGLLKYQESSPSSVPGSVRKLFCLIRAIIHHPQMLLLDDPSVGLTQDIFLKFLDLVMELRQQKFLQHIYMSSFDEKLTHLVEHKEVYIDNRQIYANSQEEKSKNLHL